MVASVQRSGHKPRSSWSHQELEEERKDSPPKPAKGVRPFQSFDFGLPASRTMREDKFLSFRATRFVVVC